MRCAKCAEIRSDELFYASAHPLQDSMQALKASADAGCDICTLCWTRLAQKYSEEKLGFLLQGLDTDGKEVADSSVWLEGLVYPSQPHANMDQKGGMAIRNHVSIVLGIGNNSLADLTIFADPGTPATRQFSETWTTVDRNPGLHIDFTRRWIEECRTKHKLCSSPFLSSEKPEMPTRLIDVGESQGTTPIRLVITQKSNIQAPYLALSYCWGTSTKSTLVLRAHNLDDLQVSIDEAQLPKTHKDVFQLARDLGFRYVWIDALCIVQGDRADWEYESQRMAHVYGNAALTIIAGRAADSQDGFVENRLRHAAAPCAIPFCGEGRHRGLPRSEIALLGHIWIALPRSARYGPVSERGWCFQEAMLSRRALVFGEEQLAFRCQELEVREDGGASRPEAYRIRSAYDSVYAPVGPDLKPLGPRGPRLDDDDEMARRWLVFWYSGVVWDYTARKITNQNDVFAAVSGLAQTAKARIRSRYLGGLWEVDMVRGLLWRVFPVMKRQRRATTVVSHPQQSGVEAQVIRTEVPSWSWAAIEGQVKLDFVSRNEPKYHESNWLVRQKYEGRWTREPTCHATAVQIKNCELEFFGRVQRVRCTRARKTQSLIPKKLFGYNVNLIPISENEADKEELEDDDQSPEDLNHVVATGWIDVGSEKVGSCWCLPLTKIEGLILVRDERGKFRRLGIMKILDLPWMMSAREEDVCLV
ncbi:heterokaryon incompatibility protein-domain-containing protein [Xylaria sp. FL1777]|nr:heterokaryon incompatibility protein-domain-containing protein [Xylaria sp. FL1777]